MTHVLTLSHGLAAALASLGIFYLAGLTLLPRRWAANGAVAIIVASAFYLAGCWIAMTQRDLPIKYVIALFIGIVLILAMVRGRSVPGADCKAAVFRRAAGERLAMFCVFYLLAYALIAPAAGDSFLPLTPDRTVELVSHARYAVHALEIGTPDDLHLAPFGYRRSPAASFLIAWQSIFFGGDPLRAALPTLISMAAVFGLAGVELLRRAGVPPRLCMVIMGVVLSGPAFRWVLAGFALPELIFATVVLVVANGSLPSAAGVAAAFVVMVLAEPVSPTWISEAVRAAARVPAGTSTSALLGFPGRMAQVRSNDLLDAAAFLLPAIALIWAGGAYLIRRAADSRRLVASASASDRYLTRALGGYVLLALVLGNVAVHAVRDPAAPRVTAAWRGMERVNALAFRGLTIKISDELDSLSTALALYFLPAKRATVIASDVTDEQLQFESVTRQTPIFVQNLGCAGAGHEDTVAAGEVGCLLLAPPSPTLGTRYPFVARYLFMSYVGLSPRLRNGRINTRPTLPLRITADPERVRLDRPLYLNLRVDTLLPPGGTPQRMVFRWGQQRAETTIETSAWVSIPLGTEHWIGNRLWTASVDIDFPDGHPVQFEEFSVTETAQGRMPVGAAPD